MMVINLLHSERSKLFTILAFLSVIGLILHMMVISKTTLESDNCLNKKKKKLPAMYF